MRKLSRIFYSHKFYFSVPFGIGQKRAKSIIYALFESSTFATLCIDGHRGLPSRVQRLLRFKVVESRPLRRAMQEQVILRLRAKSSIAFHMSACVISLSFINIMHPFICKDSFLILVESHNKFNQNFNGSFPIKATIQIFTIYIWNTHHEYGIIYMQ